MLRPLVEELDIVALRLADAAIDLRARAPWTADMMFMTSTCFLTSGMIDKITADIDNINSADELRTCMDKWSYWDGYGTDLWKVLQAAKVELRHTIDARQRKDEEIRERLVVIGFDHQVAIPNVP